MEGKDRPVARKAIGFKESKNLPILSFFAVYHYCALVNRGRLEKIDMDKHICLAATRIIPSIHTACGRILKILSNDMIYFFLHFFKT